MLLPLPFLLAEVLVVLRVHGGPAAYLVTDQPEVRRDAIDVADLPDVARAKVHFVLRIEASARLGVDYFPEEIVCGETIRGVKVLLCFFLLHFSAKDAIGIELMPLVMNASRVIEFNKPSLSF